ncbi:MAG: hypothetical protein GXO76_08540 [Calditrichaeota bacterium]|nr:hypothetical protein [Calditrichota bacterium]
MRKLSRMAVLALIFMVWISGCSKKEDKKTATGPVSQSYVPFAVGNFWTYDVKPADSDSAAYTATMKIIDTTRFEDEKAVIMETRKSTNQANWTRQYFQVTSKALLLFGWESFDASTGDTSRIFFSSPVQWVTIPFEEDKSWEIFHYSGTLTDAPLASSVLPSDDLDGDGTPDHVDLTIKGQSYKIETIKAAGKSFQAYKMDILVNAQVKMSQTGLTIPYTLKFGTFYFVPEVGIVKIVQYDMSGKATETWLLANYYLNSMIGVP